MNKRAAVGVLVAAFCASAFAVACETSAVLTHRWSFNGNLEDSVGGATAQKVGERAFNLGRGLVKGDALTFEMWATPQVKPKDNWPRIFDWGSDYTHFLFACWANNSGNAEARVQISQERILFRDDCSLAPTISGKPCHFAITVQSAKDGSSRVKWSRRDVATGAVEKAGSIDISDWSLANFIALMGGKDDFFLGHSRWSADTDALVTYDEVRLWNTALSDEQLTANVKAGPDLLPATVEPAAAFAGSVKPIPSFLFGQNLEHTRAAIQGGLSAQLVRNRKFAGKPNRLYAAKFLNEMMRSWDRNGVGMVCYFQPVNEQAITVSPFESHLTSLGEAMRLMKGHVGGVPADLNQIPREAFVTDAADGSRYLTAYNFSTKETKSFALPLGARRNVVTSELLVPNGLVSGCRYTRRPGDVRIENGKLVFALPPASQTAVRVK
ncbi:MAG: LamG domain-containing protein [Kiritimatiellae bacterium]|nr:LamG domain-containing protein [Kiritimatiellia bacterium]